MFPADLTVTPNLAVSGAALVVALPILGAFLLPVLARGARPVAAALGPVLLVLNVVVLFDLWQQVHTSGPAVVAMGGFAAPIGIVFHVDRLGLVFALATALGALLLWPRAGLDPTRERALTLLLVAAGSGLALSGDLFNLYVFYEILAVASYGLAAARGTGAAYAATIRFLILGAVGSALALLGIALIYSQTGTLNLAHIALLAPERLDGLVGLTAFALILVGFGVKAELFPVNTWVAEIYGTASSRVSALLAGVVSKLAFLVVLKVLVLAYGDGPALLLLLLLGVLGVVSGELAALRASDLRRVLAFSSIGQLGLVAVAFAVPGPAGILAGVALALHHLVVKPALFLATSTWTGPIDGLAGAARKAPVAAGLFVLLALSLVGIPPLPGFWAKLALLQGALGMGETHYALAVAAILAATVVEAAYLFRIVRVLYGTPGETTAKAPGPPALADLLPAVLLGVLLVGTTVLLTPVGDGLSAMAAEFSDTVAYVETVLGTGRAAVLPEMNP